MCFSKDLGAAENFFSLSSELRDSEEANFAVSGFLLGKWESMLSLVTAF